MKQNRSAIFFVSIGSGIPDVSLKAYLPRWILRPRVEPASAQNKCSISAQNEIFAKDFEMRWAKDRDGHTYSRFNVNHAPRSLRSEEWEDDSAVIEAIRM
jgi:hypothetical protein